MVQFAISSIFGMNFQVLIFCIEVDIFLVSSDKISFMENIFPPFLYQRKNYRKWNILSLTSMQNLFIRFFLSPMWFVKVVVCFYRYIKLLFSYNETFTHFLYIIVNTCWKKYLNVFIICIFWFLTILDFKSYTMKVYFKTPDFSLLEEYLKHEYQTANFDFLSVICLHYLSFMFSL